MTEDNARAFSYWTGTGAVVDSGDDEKICMESGEYMESEVVEITVCTVTIAQNTYASGDTAILKYRTGATRPDCLAAAWTTYTVPFVSDEYLQVRVEIA